MQMPSMMQGPMMRMGYFTLLQAAGIVSPGSLTTLGVAAFQLGKDTRVHVRMVDDPAGTVCDLDGANVQLLKEFITALQHDMTAYELKELMARSNDKVRLSPLQSFSYLMPMTQIVDVLYQNYIGHGVIMLSDKDHNQIRTAVEKKDAPPPGLAKLFSAYANDLMGKLPG